MHDQPKGPESALKRTRRYEGVVLTHVVGTYPSQLRMSELIRELTGDSGEDAERARVEDAVRDLRGVGLLFRCEALILPTRAAIRAYEVFNEAG